MKKKLSLLLALLLLCSLALTACSSDEGGDVITVKQQSQSIERIKALREGSDRVVPKWLQMDYQNLTGKVVALAAREDIDMSIEEHLIVELYSR